MMISQRDRALFENLFVLELANNHLGKLERGLRIVRDHATVVRYNNIKAAIKLQFRDVDEFVHRGFKGNKDLRYVKKTEETKLSKADFARLVEEIRRLSCIPMATPFDEASVDLCVEFDMPVIKIASSDMNDWPLLEKVASTRRPVIVSTGGASEKDLDDLVRFFERRDIPFSLNHCVSLYPSEDGDLDLDQIDYLRRRYPDHIVGLSTHECGDWHSSMLISYGKGARTWERHIDVDYEGVAVSSYCSLPEQCDAWFKAFHKAAEMCGGRGESRRVISRRETEYLDALVRGVFARRDLEPDYVFAKETFLRDFYLAIPLQKGQISCREVINGEKLISPLKKDAALTIDHVDGPYNENSTLRGFIMNRGLEAGTPPSTVAVTAPAPPPPAAARYEEDGYVVLRGAVDRQLIDDAKADLIRLAQSIDKDSAFDDLDACWNHFKHTNRANGGTFYNGFKFLPSIHRLSIAPGVLGKLAEIAGMRLPSLIDINCRIDSSGEEKYLFDWHQDYWFSIASTQAAVVWLPLVDVTEETGGLDIISNRATAGKIYRTAAGGEYNTYADAVVLDEPIPEAQAVTLTDVRAGDLVVFKFNVLHRSRAVSAATKSRFTVQLRFCDLFDQEFLGNKFRPGTVKPDQVDYLRKEAAE